MERWGCWASRSHPCRAANCLRRTGSCRERCRDPPGLQLIITRRWRWAGLSYDVQYVGRITRIFNFYVQFMLGLSGYNPIVSWGICIRKDVRLQLDDLSFYLKKLDKEKKRKCSVNRRKKTIKIRLDNDKIENKNNREITLNQELVIWDRYSCWNSSQNDADKKIKDTNYQYWEWERYCHYRSTNIKRILWLSLCQYMQQLRRNSKCLQRHKLPKLTHEETGNPNNLRSVKEIEFIPSHKENSRYAWHYW